MRWVPVGVFEYRGVYFLEMGCQPANALIKDSATLGPLALLYQNNVGNKADIIKDQEDIQDAEEPRTYRIANVPAGKPPSKLLAV
jgi:hypothetical protein